jgi:4-aminobutyrate aminotransferase-like enzyme
MGNTIGLQPPLTITRAEMDKALEILDAALGEVEGQK